MRAMAQRERPFVLVADDEPFSPQELHARVQAILARRG